jgi:hypothetical protein
MFGITTAGLTLATYNTVQISKLDAKIAANDKKLAHLIDITYLHEKHFKAEDQKIDDISNQLATMYKSPKSTLPKSPTSWNKNLPPQSTSPSNSFTPPTTTVWLQSSTPRRTP